MPYRLVFLGMLGLALSLPAAAVPAGAIARPVGVERIRLEPDEPMVLSVGDLLVLRAIAEPAQATNPTLLCTGGNAIAIGNSPLAGIFFVHAMKEGQAKVRIAAADGAGAFAQFPIEVRRPTPPPAREDGFQAYFGDLRAAAAPGPAFAAARETAGMDFLAIASAETPPEAWLGLVEATTQASRNGFLGFAGSAAGWNAIGKDSFGREVSAGGGVVLLNLTLPAPVRTATTLEQLMLGLRNERNPLAMFTEESSPGRLVDAASRFQGKPSEKLLQALALFEICNPSLAHQTLLEDSYTLALDNGWRVAPTATGGLETATAPRTAILAAALERGALLEAILQRRVYATERPDTRLLFLVNGTLMGQTLRPPAANAKTAYELVVRATSAAAPFRVLEIVSDGGDVVHSAPLDAQSIDYATTLTSASACWFYVRLTDAEGRRSWSAPV